MLNLNNIRKNILLALADKPTGHLGGSLGTVEIQSLILSNFIQYDPSWYSQYNSFPNQQKLQKQSNYEINATNSS
ncbi:MAG: hypothetical protein HC932_00265 [Thermales bacterium]|nr:hypothetical protein [Thermales bacterium]